MHCSKLQLYSITSSAQAEIAPGTSIPSAFAVVKLITNSNLTIWKTGSSPALSPLRAMMGWLNHDQRQLFLFVLP